MLIADLHERIRQHLLSAVEVRADYASRNGKIDWDKTSPHFELSKG